MEPIGGYFELELRDGEEYHPSAIRLNTGTNAFEAILRVMNFSKVYLPNYSCQVLEDSLKRLSVNYQFYSINEYLEPVFNFNLLSDNEAFLVINYFGLKDGLIKDLKGKVQNLVVDNAQSFFSQAVQGTHTFYSARKFFGVPDGAYLYTEAEFPHQMEIDYSYNRCEHLLRRIDTSPEDGFAFFRENEENLSQVPIRCMSKLTRAILKNIDYAEVRRKRVENYALLDDELRSDNQLQIPGDRKSTPMVYPFLPKGMSLFESLIHNKIYVASYWPSIQNRVDPMTLEYNYCEKLLPLPIDQRYGPEDMKKIIETVKRLINC